jgi:hypothetical protein
MMIPEINLDFALGGGAFIDGPIETTMVPFKGLARPHFALRPPTFS